MGRLREPVENETQGKLRGQWQIASTKYYKKNREEILEKARVKRINERLNEACEKEESDTIARLIKEEQK